MKLALQRKVLYLILCIALIIFIYYNLFLSPVLYQIDSMTREVSALKEGMSVIDNRNREIKETRDKIKEAEAQLLEKAADLPEDYGSHALIYLLSDADAGKLNRHSLIFLEPVSHQDFMVLPVRFSFSTDYEELMKFLSRLDSLPAKLSIPNLQIMAKNKSKIGDLSLDDNGKVVYNLDVEMTINFYVKGKNE
ncbi:MAG TPA: type 4a pilus biogenesis protein PilO [Clostridiales bacterium]|nr:type 4a pilus biogenesis protein PilO [Clostridiales bacterium]